MVGNIHSRKDADHKTHIITPSVYFSQKHKTNLIWFCFVHILQKGIEPWHALPYSSLPHLPSLGMMAEGFALSHTQTLPPIPTFLSRFLLPNRFEAPITSQMLFFLQFMQPSLHIRSNHVLFLLNSTLGYSKPCRRGKLKGK